MKKNEIIKRLESLNLDKTQYWVIAGGAMVLHGLRDETSDIDLGCTKRLADELIRRGYAAALMKDGTRRITFAEDIEIFEEWIFDKIVMLEDIPVISLNGLLEMKKDLGREKDLRDMKLIEEFLQTNKVAKNVIHIFGASGSGTSTLGKKTSELWGYTWLDTDDYFWLPTNPPFTTKREVKERVRLMKEDISKAKNVVISGSLVDWGDELIPLFTLAVRIETDTEVRLERLRKREGARFGERIAPGGDMYENHLAFLEWASQYDTGSVDMRSKAKHDEWQKLLQCPMVVVNGADNLEENCELIWKALGGNNDIRGV